MKLIRSIFLFIYISNFIVIAQDTISYTSKQIVVVDSIQTDIQEYSGMTFRNIKLGEVNTHNINDLLNSIPLINFTQYGGVGSLATIGIRGTSSNQCIISINKIPMNNSSNPYFDINLLPSELFDEVKIISIGNSSQWGSGSIGGNIDFAIDNQISKHAKVSLSIGSFGYLKSTLSQSGLIYFLPYLSNLISYETYKGDYPIQYNEFGNLKDTFRTNSEYKSLKFSNLINISNKDNITFNSISLVSLNYQQQPGAVLIGRLEESNSSIKHYSLITINQMNYKIDSSELALHNLFSIKHYKYMNNNDLLLNSSEFTSFDLTNKLSYIYEKKDNSDLSFDIGWDYNQLVGNLLQKDMGNFINRHLFFISGNYYNILKLLPLSYNVSLRIDKPTDINSIANSVAIAINYFHSQYFKTNLTLSKNYRFPSFNEMYYFNYGNTDLLPEKSLSAEISFEYTENNTLLQVFGFMNDISDKIVSIPKSTLSWSAQNFAKVLNYGLEFNTYLSILKNILIFNFNYLLQKSIDNNRNSKYYKSLIPYIPNEKISSSLEVKLNNLKLIANLQQTSHRYFLPQNIIDNLLPSYFTIDASIQYQSTIISHFPMIISMKINNLNNSNYEVIKNYPMPPRSFTFTIGSSYEKTND